MNIFDIYQEDNPDFVDDMLRGIEEEYGRGIARVAHLERTEEPHVLNIKIVFTDFRLLEAKVKVVNFYGLPSIQINGRYY